MDLLFSAVCSISNAVLWLQGVTGSTPGSKNLFLVAVHPGPPGISGHDVKTNETYSNVHFCPDIIHKL